MEVVILSAGRGRRMGNLTEETPKCLLEVQGKPVLQHQIESLEDAFKKLKKSFKVILVTGYKSGIVEKFIKKFKTKIQIVYNPFYCVSDNYMSLWMAKNELKNETLIINGDDIFCPTVIERLMKDEAPFCTVISTKTDYDSDDMKIRLNGDQITIIDKSIPEPDGENAGIIKLGKTETKALKKALEDGGKNELYMKVFWLQAINDLIAQGYSLNTLEVDREDWAEIDFHPDMEDIQKTWNAK